MLSDQDGVLRRHPELADLVARHGWELASYEEWGPCGSISVRKDGLILKGSWEKSPIDYEAFLEGPPAKWDSNGYLLPGPPDYRPRFPLNELLRRAGITVNASDDPIAITAANLDKVKAVLADPRLEEINRDAVRRAKAVYETYKHVFAQPRRPSLKDYFLRVFPWLRKGF